MTVGISSNKNGFELLKTKQMKLASLAQQKSAVEEALKNANENASTAEITVGEKQVSLSDAIVILQNFKMPTKPEEPPTAPSQDDTKYLTTQPDDSAEGGVSECFDENQYNQDVQDYNTAKAKYDAELQAYQQAEEKKAALEQAVQTKLGELGIEEEKLEDFVEVAKAKEQELADGNDEYNVTMGDIEELNQELEKADFELEVKKGGSLTQSALDQFKQLQEAGLIANDADASKYTPQELQAMCEVLVNADNANHNKTYKNGMDKHYTSMKAGTKEIYSYAQIQAMAEAAGAKFRPDDEGGFVLSEADLEALRIAQDNQSLPEQLPNQAELGEDGDSSSSSDTSSNDGSTAKLSRKELRQAKRDLRRDKTGEESKKIGNKYVTYDHDNRKYQTTDEDGSTVNLSNKDLKVLAGIRKSDEEKAREPKVNSPKDSNSNGEIGIFGQEELMEGSEIPFDLDMEIWNDAQVEQTDEKSRSEIIQERRAERAKKRDDRREAIKSKMEGVLEDLQDKLTGLHDKRSDSENPLNPHTWSSERQLRLKKELLKSGKLSATKIGNKLVTYENGQYYVKGEKTPLSNRELKHLAGIF